MFPMNAFLNFYDKICDWASMMSDMVFHASYLALILSDFMLAILLIKKVIIRHPNRLLLAGYFILAVLSTYFLLFPDIFAESSGIVRFMEVYILLITIAGWYVLVAILGDNNEYRLSVFVILVAVATTFFWIFNNIIKVNLFPVFFICSIICFIWAAVSIVVRLIQKKTTISAVNISILALALYGMGVTSSLIKNGCQNNSKLETETTNPHPEFGEYITTLDGTSYYFRSETWNFKSDILLVKNGDEKYDSALIEAFVPPKFELVDSDSIRIKCGVDGIVMPFDMIPSYGGFRALEKFPIIVTGSPFPLDIMECFKFSIPGSMLNQPDLMAETTIFRHLNISQQRLAPIVYNKMRDMLGIDKDTAKSTSDIYGAVYNGVASWFNTYKSELSSDINFGCVPVWINEQSKMFTNLYYVHFTLDGIPINEMHYETYPEGGDQPIGFYDIFNENSEKQILAMLNEIFLDENIFDFSNIFFALTRTGVAVSLKQTRFIYYGLLEYENIKHLLRPSIRKMLGI